MTRKRERVFSAVSSAAAVMVLLPCIQQVANAQTLWKKTQYGMASTEVLKTVENAKRVEDGETLGNGAKEQVRLEGIQIVDHQFSASFFFSSDKLVQVIITLQEKLSFKESEVIFERLALVLTSKYGQALVESDKQTPPVFRERKATWLSGKTNIELLLMGVSDTPAILNVVYQTRVSKEATKL